MFGGILLLATHGSVQSQPVSASQSDASASPAKNIARIAPSRPAWRELTLDQQKALYPLASVWDGLSEQHKRKWLALSRNHAKLSPAEQAVQHSRMTEWATLSQKERAEARFNFAEVKQLPADERKAKWEAYQALSAEEKRQFVDQAQTRRPVGVAPTISPVPARKLAPVVAPAHRSTTAATPRPAPPTEPGLSDQRPH